MRPGVRAGAAAAGQREGHDDACGQGDGRPETQNRVCLFRLQVEHRSRVFSSEEGRRQSFPGLSESEFGESGNQPRKSGGAP